MNHIVVVISSLALLMFMAFRVHRAPRKAGSVPAAGRTDKEPARVRRMLKAQIAASVFSILLLMTYWLSMSIVSTRELDLFLSLSALANGLAATFGFSIVHFLMRGTWLRAIHGLALLALIPEAGPTLSLLIWLLIPLSLVKNRDRDANQIMKAATIFNGTLAAGLLMLFLTLARRLSFEPMGIEALAIASGPLLLAAGIFTARDPENEFSFSTIRTLVRNGIVLLLPASVLPVLFLPHIPFLLFHHFLVPACIALACAFILILIFHFEARNIRTFLAILLCALVPTAFVSIFRELLDQNALQGIRLFSRTAMVLSSLFILRQYMRWGFEIAQTMVMFITAVAFASIVFVIVAIVQPVPGMTAIPGTETVSHAILVLDLVILAALPSLVVNFGRGTTKVTWVIFGYGLFMETYQDFLDSGAQRWEADIVSTLAYGLMALAFVTLWRYTSALMNDINSISRRLDAA